MSRLPAVGTLFLQFWLGPLGGSGSTLVAVAGVASVEVFLLEGSIDGIEDEGIKSVLVEVLLNGKDTGFWYGVPDRPSFIGNQFLGFSGECSTLSDCFRVFLQDLGSDFRRRSCVMKAMHILLSRVSWTVFSLAWHCSAV